LVVEGTRSVGRPKLRWEDGVVQDTRILGVNRWKKAAFDRDEWAKLLKKVHQGLSSHWWWWWWFLVVFHRMLVDTKARHLHAVSWLS